MDNDWFMFSFKVVRCPRRHVHDWSRCPYAHKGEVAARRDPRQFLYWPEPCPDSSKDPAKCPRGRACPYSHSVFEYWLHPARYKTQMCSIGATCRRTVCFFAHRPHELRSPDFPAMPPHAAAIEAATTVLASLQSMEGGTAAAEGELQQSRVTQQYAAWQRAQPQQQQQPPDGMLGAMDGMIGMVPQPPLLQQQGGRAAAPGGWAQPPEAAFPDGLRAGPLGTGAAGLTAHAGYDLGCPAGSGGLGLSSGQAAPAAVAASAGLLAGHSNGMGAQTYMAWSPGAAGRTAGGHELAMAAGLIAPGAMVVASSPGAMAGLIPVGHVSSGFPPGTCLQPGAAVGLSSELTGLHQQQHHQQHHHQQQQQQQQQQLMVLQRHADNQQQVLYAMPLQQQQLAGMPLAWSGALMQQQQQQQALSLYPQPSNLAYASSGGVLPAAPLGGSVGGVPAMGVGMLHAPVQTDQGLLSLQLSQLGLQAANLQGQ